MRGLSKIFGLTLYSHALISLYLCYRYAPRRRYVLFPLLSLVAGSMNAEGYIINDSHFLLSVYWPVLFMLLFTAELTPARLVLLLSLSFVMLLSYESMIVFGAILAGVCVWRSRATERFRGVIRGLAIWYVLGALLAVCAAVWPHDPGNRDAFVQGLAVVLQSDHLAVKVSLGVLLGCSVLLGAPARLVKLQGLTCVVGLVAIAVMTVHVLMGIGPRAVDQVPARVLNLLAPLVATILLLGVFFGWLRPNRRAIGLTAILIGGLGCGQAMWSVGYLMQWRAMVATLQQEISRREGPIALKDSALSGRRGSRDLSRLYIGWSLLPLSLYEAPEGRVQAVIVPDMGGFVPFDPFNPGAFPDLSAYGIRYDRYRAALSNRSVRSGSASP